MNSELRVGDIVACVKTSEFVLNCIGRVICTTPTIGVEFEEPVLGHSCDRQGKYGYCLWFPNAGDRLALLKRNNFSSEQPTMCCRLSTLDF